MWPDEADVGLAGGEPARLAGTIHGAGGRDLSGTPKLEEEGRGIPGRAVR